MARETHFSSILATSSIARSSGAIRTIDYTGADPLGDSHGGDHGIYPAGAGKDAGVGDVEPVMDTPNPSVGVDDAVVGAGTHPASAHLMGRAEGTGVWRSDAEAAELGEPGLKFRGVDAVVEGFFFLFSCIFNGFFPPVFLFSIDRGGGGGGLFGSGSPWSPNKGRVVGVETVDLACAADKRDLGRGDDTLNQVLGIEARGTVFDPHAAIGGVSVNDAGVAVAADDDEPYRVVEAGAPGFEG